MYFDYDFEKGEQASYNYITTFYPLWAGASSAEQIAGVEKNLKLLEQPGGIAMATDSGVQWDLPFGWTPASWIAIDGMVRVDDSATRCALRRNSARPFVTVSRMTGQSAKNTTSSMATPRWMSRPATKQMWSASDGPTRCT